MTRTVQRLVDSGLGQEVVNNTGVGGGHSGQGKQGSAQAQELSSK